MLFLAYREYMIFSAHQCRICGKQANRIYLFFIEWWSITILGHKDPTRPLGEHPLVVNLTPLQQQLSFARRSPIQTLIRLNPVYLQLTTNLGLQGDTAAEEYSWTLVWSIDEHPSECLVSMKPMVLSYSKYLSWMDSGMKKKFRVGLDFNLQNWLGCWK